MSDARDTAGLPPRDAVSRRGFLRAAGIWAAAVGGPGLSCAGGETAPKPGMKPKVTVGAHPWVYAAKQPGYDITPILPDIFADMAYAGMDGIELMGTALRPKDAVERIRALSEKHRLPVIGASFGGAMWDRGRHAAVIEDAERVIGRLAELGGRTLGTRS